MAQETKKITDLTALTNLTAETLFVTHDGTGARKATMQQIWDFFPNLSDGPGAHNAIYRGKYLGSAVSDDQYNAINAGTFADMYIGDYWTIGGVNYRIVAFDYYMRCGNGEAASTGTFPGTGGVTHTFTYTGDVQKHHVTLMPDAPLYNTKMNDSATTDGGYCGSKMYRGTPVYTALSGTTYYSDAAVSTSVGVLDADYSATRVNATYCTITIEETTYYVKTADIQTTYDITQSGLYSAKNTIITAFGAGHLLAHRKYLVDTASGGVASAGSWRDSFCELPNEIDMYGTTVNAAVNSNNKNHYRYTIDKTQFPLFRYRPDLISNRQYFWLQDIVTSASFAFVRYYGSANGYDASYTYGVRPVFSIVKS